MGELRTLNNMVHHVFLFAEKMRELERMYNQEKLRVDWVEKNAIFWERGKPAQAKACVRENIDTEMVVSLPEMETNIEDSQHKTTAILVEKRSDRNIC